MWPLVPAPRARVRNVWQILLPGLLSPLPLSLGKGLVVEDDAAELAKDCRNGPEPFVPALASASSDDVATGLVCVCGPYAFSAHVADLQTVSACEAFIAVACGQRQDLVSHCVWL